MHILGFCVKKPKYRVFGRFFWPKSTFEGTFRESTFKVRYLKVPSKVDLGQKKRPKTRYLGFLTQKPKMCIFGRFFWLKSTFKGILRFYF